MINSPERIRTAGPLGFHLPRGIPALACAVVGVGVGIAAILSPVLGLGVVLLAASLVLILRFSLSGTFLGVLGALLFGYAFLGRGFAHIGVPPVYVGELGWILAVGVLVFVRPRSTPGVSALTGLLLVFIGLGLLRTIPYISQYGLDSLRDAVLWGYAAFALAVSRVVQPRHFDTVLRWYRRLAPVFVFWVPVSAGLYLLAPSTLPKPPGSDLPLLIFKGGDMAVHLAGVAAFILLGLYSLRSRAQIREILLWPIWILGVAVAGVINRGGLVSAVVATGATLLVRPTRRWLYLLGVGAVVAVVVVTSDPQVDLGLDRRVSVAQLGADVNSLLSTNAGSSLDGTRSFRLNWWSEIVSYTFGGKYFWTGKGFGVNLADDDNFQPTADHSLRSPHNSHFTVLARMGVPGLSLWVLIQIGFALSLLSGIRRSRRSRDPASSYWSTILAWLFIYWLAMMVNTSFDPYLEGPQGGIWFWAIFGLGLAALRCQRESSGSVQNTHFGAILGARPSP